MPPNRLNDYWVECRAGGVKTKHLAYTLDVILGIGLFSECNCIVHLMLIVDVNEMEGTNLVSTLIMSSIVQRHPDQLSAGMDGETVMMNIENSSYYGLNAVGTEVWELIEKPASVAAICKRVTEIFEVEQKSCETDILELLTDLLESKMVIRVE